MYRLATAIQKFFGELMKSSGNRRIIIKISFALTVFVVFVVFAGGLTLWYFTGKSSKQALVPAPIPGSQDIFYKAIGTAPPLNGIADDSDDEQINELYSLEVKTVNSRREAEKSLAELAKSGAVAYYTPVQIEGKVYYKVRMGSFQNKDEAEKNSALILAKTQIQSKVVQFQ